MTSKYVSRFDSKTAPSGHNGTILAGRCMPEGLAAPFDSAWGYLSGQSMMEPHAHPTEEIYTVFTGKGFCHVNNERFPVIPGDIIHIPPDAEHTMECCAGDTLLWAAFWWKKV